MTNKFNIHIFMICCFLFTATMGFARDYVIFSIAQNISMGTEDTQPKKNYYVNLGQQQGVDSGTALAVYRIISLNDPFETKERHDYRVKIGELEVLHSEQESSIAIAKDFESGDKVPMFQIGSFMVGDKVNVDTE